MSQPPSHFRPTARWLLAALVLLGAAAPAAQAARWRLEPIVSSDGVAELHTLAFDANGRALLSWDGVLRRRVPPAFGGLATRESAGVWLRAPDLAGVQPDKAQIHLFARTRALLVAREEAGPANLRRLVLADGRSDGSFGTLTALEAFVTDHWSHANEAGDAIVAWTSERSVFVRVAERSADQAFEPAKDLAVGRTAAVAMNARGDRVLAWRAGTRLAARVRSPDGDWSRTVRFGRLQPNRDMRLSALVVDSGRAVLTWGLAGRPCGVSVRDASGRWRTRTLEPRCGPAATGRGSSPVRAIADSSGATYVAWTGYTRNGRRAVKFARVGPGAPGAELVLSHERGAVLDDAAAGPGRTLAVTYAAPRPTRRNPLIVATFARLRRAGGAFSAVERLTPANFAGRRGSRIAFHPLTGEPVVALPFLIGLNTAVGAAVGPAVRATGP